MSGDAELRKASQDFQESLEQLHVGAITHEDNNPIEEDILHLKEILEFINSKYKGTKITDLPVEQKNYENVDFESKKTELIDNLIISQNNDTGLHTILMGHVLESVKHSSTIEIFKQKVIKQLELLRNNCECTMELYDRKDKILNESNETFKIINKQISFSNILQEKEMEYKKKCEDSFGEAYKRQMEKIKQRVNKINYMSVVTRRLLIYSNIDWKKMPEFKEIVKDTSFPVTLNSLLKE